MRSRGDGEHHRHIEDGMGAVRGFAARAKEIGFNRDDHQLSLISVFIPLLFDGGIIGRLFANFRDYAVRLDRQCGISLTRRP